MKKIAIVTFAFSLHMANAQVCFSPASNINVGTSASTVISTDFNGDGFGDLAVANDGSNNITILLGDGAGSFSSSGNFGAGTGPYSLWSADFNGDGKADLATSNGGSNNVSVILGNGNGTFGAATNFSVGTNPTGITIADFNGDGNKDIVTANYGSNNISLLIGTGTGSFGAATNITVGTGPHSVAYADFNSDGFFDLAVANYGSANISVMQGTGTGTFGAITNSNSGTGPYTIIAKDLNGDGKADLATANSGSNNISVLLNNGTGTIGSKTDFSLISSTAAPTGITAGDFDGDTKQDLAVTNQGSDNLSILIGTGTGTFSQGTTLATFPVGTSPNAAINADLNADGKNDIVIANWGSNNISVLLNAPLPVITVSATATALCTGKSDTLRASGGVTYTFAGTPSGYANGGGFVPTATKTYTITGTDASGCVNKATVTITVNPLPTLTVTASSNPVCMGSTTTLTATGASTYTWTGGVTNGSAFTPTMTATYSVTATDTMTGCVGKSTKTVTVNPVPVVTISVGNDTICAGDSTLMIALGAVTYTWSTSTVNDSLWAKPVVNTAYIVTGTDANGCQNQKSTIITVNCMVGINQVAKNTLVKIYPNPANEVFVIETNTNEKQLMHMYDISGKMVMSETINGRSNINTGNLKEGVYTVSLTGNEGITNSRLIIVK